MLWFKRGDHPGLITPRRLELLEEWSERLSADGEPDALMREVLDGLWTDWSRLSAETLETKSRRLRGRLRPIRIRATALKGRLRQQIRSPNTPTGR